MASSGNFATWNRLVYSTNFRNGMNPSYGNTRANPGNSCIGFTNMAMNTGKKWYIEAYAILAYNIGTIGIFSVDSYATKNNFNANYHNSDGIFYHSNGQLYIESNTSSTTTSYVSGDVIGLAVDLESTTETVKFYKNGSLQDTVNIPSGFLNRDWFLSTSRPTSGGGYIMNAGQDSTFGGTISAGGNADGNGFGDFKYSVPSGYLALCSGNLGISDDIDPAQTDDDYPSKQFGVVLFNGNGSTNAVTGLGFKPDLIWGFTRDGSQSKRIVDSSRGGSERLHSDLSDAATTGTVVISEFGTDGFTANGGQFNNDNGKTCGAWCWRLNGGTTASNTSGDINSTTQASDKTGLSIVLYTGNGSQGQSIGHGLTKAPEMVWFKNRSNATVSGLTMDWIVALSTSTGSPFASRSGSSQCLELNTSDAITSFYRNEGNFTPTTSTFSVPANGNAPYWFNASSNNYLAYCWHSVEGFSKFGLYEGNGNADGAFIYTGFRPRMIFVKDIDRSESWQTFDSARNTFNPVDKGTSWNTSSTESTGSGSGFDVDFLSNGFKMRCSHDNLNGSSTYIYGAWGDVPFKYNNTF